MANKIQQNSFFQIVLVGLFWLASELLLKLVKLPLSGGILGLGIVLLLLATNCLKLNRIRRGAELLLANMLLFFIPGVLAILEHRKFIGLLGLKILFIILLSTITVMLVTALVVDYCYRWRTHHAKQHSL
ncbi:TPA: CidA/LrgA family protein [Legionella pneumophila]